MNNAPISSTQPVNFKACRHTVDVPRIEVEKALLARVAMNCPVCGRTSRSWMAAQPGTKPMAF